MNRRNFLRSLSLAGMTLAFPIYDPKLLASSPSSMPPAPDTYTYKGWRLKWSDWLTHPHDTRLISRWFASPPPDVRWAWHKVVFGVEDKENLEILPVTREQMRRVLESEIDRWIYNPIPYSGSEIDRRLLKKQLKLGWKPTPNPNPHLPK